MGCAQNLISQIKPPNTYDVVKAALNSPHGNGRTALLRQNARMDGRVDDNVWEEYNKFVYLRWYNHIKKLSENDIDKILQKYNFASKSKDGKTHTAQERVARYRAYLDEIRDNPKYKPEEIEKNSNYFQFLKDECTHEKLSGFAPYTDQDNQGVFFHIHHLPTEQEQGKTQFRFYLNISADNITKVSQELMQRCDQANLPVYFKTATQTGESDVIVIYTSYKDAQAYVDILKQLKAEKPKLFIGAEKIAQSEGSIAGFIGCGEEPEYKKSSYNAERGAIIESLKPDFILKNAKQVTTPNFTKSNAVNFQGKQQTLFTFLGAQLQGFLQELPEFKQKKIDADFKSEKNAVNMRNLGIKVLRNMINGENKKLCATVMDKNGKNHTFYNIEIDLGQKLLDVCGNKTKEEMLEHFFEDATPNRPNYNKYCFKEIKTSVVTELNNRIQKSKNGFCDGVFDHKTKQPKQIPVSLYQTIISDVQNETQHGKRFINKGVWGHILDLYENSAEMNDHNKNPKEFQKPYMTSTLFMKFNETHKMQDVYIYGFATKALGGFMQQNNIKPIMPTEEQIRGECLKRDVSYDNFFLNETSNQKYIEWQSKQKV